MVLLHLTDKPFSCDQCALKFETAHNLKIHVRKEHKKVIHYICNFHNKAFGSSTNLKTHVHLHTDKMEVHCDICNKGLNEAT